MLSIAFPCLLPGVSLDRLQPPLTALDKQLEDGRVYVYQGVSGIPLYSHNFLWTLVSLSKTAKAEASLSKMK